MPLHQQISLFLLPCLVQLSVEHSRHLRVCSVNMTFGMSFVTSLVDTGTDTIRIYITLRYSLTDEISGNYYAMNR